MTAYPAWTPASRPGIIPLRPLDVRHDPRALVRRAAPEPARAARLRPRACRPLAYLLVLLGVGARRARVVHRDSTRSSAGTEEFDAVMAGSIALTAIAGHRARPRRRSAGRHRAGRRRQRGRARRGRREADPRARCGSGSSRSRGASSATPSCSRSPCWSLIAVVGGGDHRDRLRRAAGRVGLTILVVLAAHPAHAVAVDEAPARARRRSSSSTRPSAARSRARGRSSAAGSGRRSESSSSSRSSSARSRRSSASRSRSSRPG